MRVIQVGVGGFGTSWRPALTTLPEVKVVALVDINPANLKEAAQFFSLSESQCFPSDELPWEQLNADVMVHSAPRTTATPTSSAPFAPASTCSRSSP